jgi:hypothetical protein
MRVRIVAILSAPLPFLTGISGAAAFDIQSFVQEAVRNTVQSATQSAVHSAVQSAVQSGVRSATQSAVHSAVQGATQSVVHSAVHSATQSAVHGATQSAVHSATQSAVHSATRNAIQRRPTEFDRPTVNATTSQNSRIDQKAKPKGVANPGSNAINRGSNIANLSSGKVPTKAVLEQNPFSSTTPAPCTGIQNCIQNSNGTYTITNNGSSATLNSDTGKVTYSNSNAQPPQTPPPQTPPPLLPSPSPQPTPSAGVLVAPPGPANVLPPNSGWCLGQLCPDNPNGRKLLIDTGINPSDPIPDQPDGGFKTDFATLADYMKYLKSLPTENQKNAFMNETSDIYNQLLNQQNGQSGQNGPVHPATDDLFGRVRQRYIQKNQQGEFIPPPNE